MLVHRQHGDDDFGILGHLSYALGTFGSGADHVIDGLLVDVKDRELVALLQQVLRHEGAHVAQTDEADIGEVALTNYIF